MAEQPAAGSTRRHATLAIIGLPNAGKSTLLNALLGQKLAATSQIPQTTRTRVLGVVDRGEVQLAFLDTPGIHLPKHALNERMMAHVEQALEEADLLLWVVDADDYLGTGEHALAKRLRKLGRPTYLLLNKVDLLSKGRLLEKIATYKDLLPFKEIVPIGAKMGLNLDPLWTILERDATLPGWLHEEEVFTDQTERSLASEFIREKVLRKTREEVPHGVAVYIEQWLEADHEEYPEDMDPGGVLIAAQILVDRDGHRKILLGSGGEMIKDIRQSAQRELKKLLQRPVRLELFVKVDEGWRDRPERLDRLEL
ncbi:MAG: GTPase Era [Holophagaceae bacterium]|uniref:GTPase Era n=1 Tax=Candidatus Geothrix skivensis TaxID=2954439 RepID=A0A9D7SFK7_9BACT|nr:GTPase Era [Candidatus Geothrix skivensis]